jgi:hypothetical protein
MDPYSIKIFLIMTSQNGNGTSNTKQNGYLNLCIRALWHLRIAAMKLETGFFFYDVLLCQPGEHIHNSRIDLASPTVLDCSLQRFGT